MNSIELLMDMASTKRCAKENYPYRVYNLLKKNKIVVDRLKFIHITGSKGKGSIAVTSFQLLKESGERVGLFISPHIFDIRERFVTDRGQITEKNLLSLIQKWELVLRENELHFFELCLFLALVYFIEEKCEYVVLEVGIGGRYDPTNFCHPIVSILGHISMEHRNFLGDTLEEIAYDKAGIIKENTPNFSMEQEKSVREIVEKEGKVSFFSDFIKINDLKIVNNNIQISAFSNNFSFQNLKFSRLGWANVNNFFLTVWALKSVYPLKNSVIEKVAQMPLPYRMEIFHDNIVIDTAHNGASFKNLLDTINDFLQWKNITLFLTIIEGKELSDIVKIIKTYKSMITRIICFECENSANKKTQARKLADLLEDFIEVEYYEQLTYNQIDISKKNVFAGSFYSIPMIVNLLKGNKSV